MTACIGMAAHTWELCIEEGSTSVTTEPCGDECHFLHGLGDEREWLEMKPVPVLLMMATNCPAYDTDDNGVPTGPPRLMGGYETGSHYIVHGERCDCNWWPIATALGAPRPTKEGST